MPALRKSCSRQAPDPDLSHVRNQDNLNSIEEYAYGCRAGFMLRAARISGRKRQGERPWSGPASPARAADDSAPIVSAGGTSPGGWPASRSPPASPRARRAPVHLHGPPVHLHGLPDIFAQLTELQIGVTSHQLDLRGEMPAHELVLFAELLARVVRARQDERGEGHRDGQRGAEYGDDDSGRVGLCRIAPPIRGARPRVPPCNLLCSVPSGEPPLPLWPSPPATFAGSCPTRSGDSPVSAAILVVAGERAMGNSARSS